MSLYAMADDVFAGDVASTGGWSDFGRWAESLDDSPEIANLWHNGWSQEPAALLEELSAANGMSESVRGIVKALRSAVEANENADVIVVTDGVGAEEDA